MKVSYRGLTQVLSPKLQEKLDAKFSKLSKLLEKRGEKEAHVVMTKERFQHHAEITLHFYDHQLACKGTGADDFTAIMDALDKLETQAVKQRGKWREKHRREKPVLKTAEASVASPPKGPAKSLPRNPPKTAKLIAGKANGKTPPAKSGPESTKIFRRDHHELRKPMTLEEAMLEMDGQRDYMVYRDSDRQCVSVLVRRRDGNFDLIES